ncbi:SIS domain-containing protein [Sphingomonas sp. ST-64]|uniref:SIS domain-containing protein n=1 Tax=Sphingomonas plantiphila TaxID=3163295 RepID=A0ABW8YJZ3_9SPHN
MADLQHPVLAGDLLSTAHRLLRAEQRAIALLDDIIDEAAVAAATALAACRGRILTSGIGKSGIVGRKLAATLCSLDVPAQFLHAGDALHGDLGAVRAEDMVVAISYSGTTRELMRVIEHARGVGAGTAVITAFSHAAISLLCDHVLLIPQCEEGSGDHAAPMASTIASIAMGDVLALLVAQLSGHRRGQMHALHPAGDLGRKLRPLKQVMVGGDRVPIVPMDAASAQVIREITAKGQGIVGVVDAQGLLVGTVSDGDIRRHASAIATCTARELMVEHPIAVDMAADISQALDLMRLHRVSTIFVVEDGRAQGLVHIQDLLRVGIL